ncbi:hypothetical protein ACCS33_10660 [Rhizobium ruizarguesonis]|nr:hypothetical protein [Rhizobium leguminosarum bv. viciae]
MKREGCSMHKVPVTYEALHRVDLAMKLNHALDMMICAIDDDDHKQALYQIINECSQHLKEAFTLLEAVLMNPERKSA